MGDMAFTWRGVSSDSHGVVVRSLPPIYTPQARDDAIIVPGRHGSLHIQDGAYEEQLMMIEGYLPYEQGVPVSDIETIKAWLVGYGDLTLSDRPGRKYRARVVDAVAFSAWVAGFADRIFSVSFWADPLAYEANPQGLAIVAAHTDLPGRGTAAARPLITVTGTGTVSVTLNGVTLRLDDMAGGAVVIDCDAKFAYKESDGSNVAITLVDEKWPDLGPGENEIERTGAITELLIAPNWRWL